MNYCIYSNIDCRERYSLSALADITRINSKFKVIYAVVAVLLILMLVVFGALVSWASRSDIQDNGMLNDIGVLECKLRFLSIWNVSNDHSHEGKYPFFDSDLRLYPLQNN